MNLRNLRNIFSDRDLAGLMFVAWSFISGPVSLYLLLGHADAPTIAVYYLLARFLELSYLAEMGIASSHLISISKEVPGNDFADRRALLPGNLTFEALKKIKACLLQGIFSFWVAATILLTVGLFYFDFGSGDTLISSYIFGLVIFAGASNLLAPFGNAVLDGLGYISRRYWIQLLSNITRSLVLWYCILSGNVVGGLVASILISSSIYIILLLYSCRSILLHLCIIKISINYFFKIINLIFQLRLATTFLFGGIVLNGSIFILYRAFDSAIVGQFAITLALAELSYMLGIVFINRRFVDLSNKLTESDNKLGIKKEFISQTLVVQAISLLFAFSVLALISSDILSWVVPRNKLLDLNCFFALSIWTSFRVLSDALVQIARAENEEYAHKFFIFIGPLLMLIVFELCKYDSIFYICFALAMYRIFVIIPLLFCYVRLVLLR